MGLHTDGIVGIIYWGKGGGYLLGVVGIIYWGKGGVTY